jgi:hypothetical protein
MGSSSSIGSRVPPSRRRLDEQPQRRSTNHRGARANRAGPGVILAIANQVPAQAYFGDPLGYCSTPCPSQTCYDNDDCEPGFSCVPYGTIPGMGCTPGSCNCDDEGIWWCTGDCAPICVADTMLVPAASPWGVALLALLVLSAGTGLILAHRKVS